MNCLLIEDSYKEHKKLRRDLVTFVSCLLSTHFLYSFLIQYYHIVIGVNYMFLPSSFVAVNKSRSDKFFFRKLH